MHGNVIAITLMGFLLAKETFCILLIMLIILYRIFYRNILRSFSTGGIFIMKSLIIFVSIVLEIRSLKCISTVFKNLEIEIIIKAFISKCSCIIYFISLPEFSYFF